MPETAVFPLECGADGARESNTDQWRSRYCSERQGEALEAAQHARPDF